MFIAAMAATLLLAFCAGAKATTVATLMDDLLSDLGQDSSNSQYTHAQRMRFLNRGQNAVATIIGGVEYTQRIPLVDSSADYALASGFWGIEAVLYRRSIDYLKLSYELPRNFGTAKFSSLVLRDSIKEGKTEQATVVEQYSIFNDTLMIYPASVPLTGDTLLAKIFVAPASLDSLSQTTQMKFWTDDFVVEAAVFFANKRDLSLADELSWWTSFANRILAAQSLYARPTKQGVATQ